MVQIVRSLGFGNLKPPPPPAEEHLPKWRRALEGMRHTKKRDAEAIHHHYDVSNRFYELVLGPSMTYTCAVYPTLESTLEEAQHEKYDLIARKLDLQPGQRLLDVGCGWGGMVRHAAKHYGVKALGVTLSREQAAWAQEEIKRQGLDHLAEVRFLRLPRRHRDRLRRDQLDRHDRAHRRQAATASTSASCSGRLKVGGRLLNHCITRPNNKTISTGAFIDRYVFPDGELTGVGRITMAAQDAGLEVRHVENLREHYALTLQGLVRQPRRALGRGARTRSRSGAPRSGASTWPDRGSAFERNEIELHHVLAVKTDAHGQCRLAAAPHLAQLSVLGACFRLVRVTDLDVLRDQISYIDVDPYAVAAHALRFGFPGAPDLLALMASGGREGFTDLLAACDRFVASAALRAPAELAARYEPRAVGALAQAMIGKTYRGGDYAVTARLHRFAHALGPVDDQPTGFARLLVQTNVAAGEHAYVDALLAAEPDLADDHLRWIIRTDRLGPAETGAAFDAAAWSASFTEIFADVAPVRLGGGDGPLFDRLTAPAPAPVDGGPLVSVVMSVFAPDSSFEASVRSILAQTYRNLELFVVDDCSPAAVHRDDRRRSAVGPTRHGAADAPQRRHVPGAQPRARAGARRAGDVPGLRRLVAPRAARPPGRGADRASRGHRLTQLVGADDSRPGAQPGGLRRDPGQRLVDDVPPRAGRRAPRRLRHRPQGRRLGVPGAPRVGVRRGRDRGPAGHPGGRPADRRLTVARRLLVRVARCHA